MTEKALFFFPILSSLANTNPIHASFLLPTDYLSPNNPLLKSVGAMQAHEIQQQILGAN